MNEIALSVLRGLAIADEPRALLRPQPAPAAFTARQGFAASGSAVRELRPGGPSDASEMAAPLVDPAELEQLRRDAYRQGMEQGRREGFAEGREEGLQKGQAEGRQLGQDAVLRETQAAREDLGTLIDRLDQLLATLPGQFRESLATRLAASEDDMVALSHAAICRLLGERVLDRDAVVYAVRQAIAECSGPNLHSAVSRPLSIHVHPRDLEMLRSDSILAAWLDRQGSGAIPWQADESVHLGGCIVHTAQGSLDARLETQLAALQAILLSGRASRPDHGVAPPIESGDRR